MPRRIITWLTLTLLMLSGIAWVPQHSLASVVQQAPANLVDNPGFENGLTAWSACGGARVVDAQAAGTTPRMVHSGRYAIRMGGPTSPDCPGPSPKYSYESRIGQALIQSITIPADAPAVTVSFWYSIESAVQSDMYLMLANDLYAPSYGSADGNDVARLYSGDLPGWQLFRGVLSDEDLARAKGLNNLSLFFRIDDPISPGTQLAYYIDDIQVTPAVVRTTASPLPPALQGDGTRPLAIVRSKAGDNFSYGVFTMDTDGSNLQSIYPGELNAATGPAWSNDGGTIAIIDRNVYPRDLNTGVSATALVLVNPDGSNPRTIYQTEGRKGPPDFIQQITEFDWSPDNRAMVASIFAYNRTASGRFEGCLARIEVVDPLAKTHAEILRFATNPHWSRTNRLLFESYTACGGDRLDGIWEASMATQPVADQRLLPGPRSFYDEGEPTWSPDGRYFVTTRTVTGPHQAIMLFDQQDLLNPRLILLGDHGSVRAPTWSPDGKYLAYTLVTDQGSNLWWLDVATGATGPITTDGLSSNADWRPCPGVQLGVLAACGGATALGNKVYLPMVQR